MPHVPESFLKIASMAASQILLIDKIHDNPVKKLLIILRGYFYDRRYFIMAETKSHDNH
jgi:hypothetical protein